jgi:serine kinase of HPr protein (carbohydrate metabolism regulator)
MADFKIKVCGFTAQIRNVSNIAKDYFADFLTDENPFFCFTITSEDIEYERKKCISDAEFQKIPYREYSDAFLESIAIQRKITEALFEYNTLLFHGSAIAFDGFAYLFCAKSGTGKSTHTRLWRECFGARATMVNDDKPFVSVRDGAIIIHGSPWNGKHRLGSNISVPLKAICILERGEVNKIEQIPPIKALKMLMQQSSRPQDNEKMGKYLELLDLIAKEVKFYRLECNMDIEAARISFEGMAKDN